MSLFMCCVSSLSCISPIPLFFLLMFLFSAADVIVASSFIPREFHFVFFLDSLPFTRCFLLIREVLKGFWGLCLSPNWCLILVMLCLLSQLMLIVFPLIVLTYTVMKESF